MNRLQVGRYDSAVSLQNYYAWEQPAEVLRYIHGLLRAGGLFLLATINPHYDQQVLFHVAEKELMWYPDYKAFKQSNRQLANKPQTRFISQDRLIRQLQQTGSIFRE